MGLRLERVAWNWEFDRVFEEDGSGGRKALVHLV